MDNLCAGTRVTRTVLRSEMLRTIQGQPLDLIITSSGILFFASDEFLRAFAAMAQPVAMLVITRRAHPDTLEPLRRLGVRAEHIEIPIEEAALRERVQAALHPRRPATVPAIRGATPPDARDEETGNPTGKHGDREMANINKTLEEAMKIDGAIGTALADWDSGLCLGALGGGDRINIEVAAAGNCQVVKAKMATMAELGIKGAIHDILITLDDQIHLIRPLKRGESLFIYLAIDKVKGNLGMARHRLQKLEAELSV